MPHDIKKILEEKSGEIDKIIEKWVPRNFDDNHLRFLLGEPSYKYTPAAVTKAISIPMWDMIDRGGKRWRPVLFLLVTEALGGDLKKVSDFVIIPELIHTATLIVDDIEDRSEVRRGQPCAYKKFGLDVAINCGEHFYFMPMLPIIKHKNDFPSETINKAYEVYLKDMINVTCGQGTDIIWHNGMADADSITEEEYLQMCANKTGCLARMSAKLAAVLSGATDEQIEKIGKLAETIGVAFQIQDDILNLVGEEFVTKKGGAGEDITEGKRTLLVIHILKKASPVDKNRLIEILNMHTLDQNLRNEAIEIIKKYGAIEYAKEFARKMVRESWAEVDALFPPSEAKEKIKAFADYLVEREI